MSRLIKVVLFCVILIGILGLVLVYQMSQEGSGVASFNVRGGFGGVSYDELFDDGADFTLNSSTTYDFWIAAINNGSVRLTNMNAELTHVPQVFQVPWTVGDIGHLSKGSSEGTQFELTTPATFGSYGMEITVSCDQLTRMFLIEITVA